MRKAFKNKLSCSRNLVRKVLSKSSLSSVSSNENKSKIKTEMSDDTDAIIAQEIESLKHQIANLKAAVFALQDETDQKDVAMAKLSREREKVYQDYVKQKRTNASLIKQLESERKFYYKEKEIYCKEMNECKKLKIAMSTTSTAASDEKTIQEYKNDIHKLKLTLNQTLEANYNLSVKFLRMKNTKTCMKTELKKMQLDHDKLVNDMKIKIENLTSELNTLVHDKISTAATASSKKYLQLVKQNSCLVYENLCLQLEADKLNLKFDKMKLQQSKSEVNNKLKYIKHPASECSLKRRKPDQLKKHVRINVDTPEKLEKPPQPSCSHSFSKVDTEIVKIYERESLPGIPSIRMLHEDDSKSKIMPLKPSKENLKKVGADENSKSLKVIINDLNSVTTPSQTTTKSMSSVGISSCKGLIRVQSAPELAQSAIFINNKN